MRTPISCVRAFTEYAITPNTPTAASASAVPFDCQAIGNCRMPIADCRLPNC
jgi:hypothetical protein